MGMVVRTNTMAINAQRQLNLNNNKVSKSLEKLASGYKINRAGDDAAGLAISERMKAQIKGLDAASNNSQDGISLIQTAEGALNEVHDMMNRMVELATKAANGVYTESQRGNYKDEMDQLKSEINRIADSTNFNSLKLLDGTMGLNSSAFTVGKAVAATDGSLTLSTADIHLGGKSSTFVAPAFSIDLADFKVTGTGAAATVTVNVAGQDITATLDDLATATNGEATAIGAKIVAAVGAMQDGKLKIGDAYFTATNANGKISFAYAGLAAKGNAAANTDKLSGEQAAAINKLIGSAVTATVGGTGGTAGGRVYDATVGVTTAVGEVTAPRAGMDIDISSIVKQGYKLTIDDKTYVFRTDANATITPGANEEVINVSGVDADKQLQEAVNLLSQKTATRFEISAKNATTIHIDQLKDNNDVFDTEAGLKSLVSAQGTAANANRSVTINSDNIKDGDSINVNGKTYKLVAKATGDNNEVTITGLGTTATSDDIAAALATAIGTQAKADGNVVTVTAATAEDAAPQILGGGLTLQVGDTYEDFNILNVSASDMHTAALGLDGVDITTQASAGNSINLINSAIDQVSKVRSGFGALQNRLEHTINNLDTTSENLTAANSRIRDTDMAKEMMEYTKMNVLVQSAQAMLAQANQQPQSVLQLLQ